MSDSPSGSDNVGTNSIGKPDTSDAVAELKLPLKTTPRSSSSFTIQNFLDLNNKEKSYISPLAIIGHIDVNAFFAQVEQLRLGYSVDDPVVCIQWNTIIAVSYAARKYGISRLTTLDEAKKKCPNLILGHTAVFKKGESDWSYTDYLPSPVDHKVSLDPYRRESRKLLKIIKSFCPLAEKASVDESFIDFGKLIFERSRELFPNLLGTIDPSSKSNNLLPNIPNELPSQLQWEGYIAHTENEEINEQKDYTIEDWDDIFTLIGSQLGNELRRLIYEELGYFTSLGIGRVKTIAKLASGYKKPNNQTIVRNSAINQFLTNFQFTDFWSLGGKTGEIIRQKLNIPQFEDLSSADNTIDNDYSNLDYNDDDDEDLLTQEHEKDYNRLNQKKIDSIGYIRKYFTLKELELKLNDNSLAETLYKIVRGELYSPLAERVDVKSMGSNKNFRGKSVCSSTDLVPWFKVYASDLCQRIQELDEESNSLRRPRSLSVSVRNARIITRSRQCPLPPIQDRERLEETMYQTAIKALKELEANWDVSIGRMYPATNCALSVSKFELIDNTKSLDHFFGKTNSKSKTNSPNIDIETPKIEQGHSLNKEMNQTPSPKQPTKRNLEPLVYVSQKKKPTLTKKQDPLTGIFSKRTDQEEEYKDETQHNSDSLPSNSFFCDKCKTAVVNTPLDEHLDWHVARDIAQELNGNLATQNYEDSYAARVFRSRQNRSSQGQSRQKSTKKNRGSIDTFQSKLPF